MKNKFKTIGGLVALSMILATAASCKKDKLSEDVNQPIPGVERTINVSATLPQPTEKAYLDVTDGRKVKWEPSDAINVNGSNLALTNLYTDPTKARFEGTTYAISSGSNDVYWFVYPTILAGTASGSTIPSSFTANRLTVTLPDVQTFDLSQTKILEGSTYMAAKASVPAGQTNLNFSMKNLCAVLKIHLSATGVSNTNVERIVFNSSSRLNGDFYFDGSAVTASTASVCNYLTINLTDGTNSYIDIAGGVDVYAILPPINSSKLSMTVYNTDGLEVTKIASSVTLAQNTMYTNNLNVTAFSAPVTYFSVSASKRVVFAPGNLQWSATNGGATATTHAVAGGGTADGTWRFASNQWNYIGNAAGNNTAAASRETQAAWIDFFGWGTSGYHDVNDVNNVFYYPYSSSNTNLGYSTNTYGYGPSTDMTDPNLVGTSANYDWGIYNAIYNPKTNTTDPAGTWRTPTSSELLYVIGTRTTCSGARFAKARVSGVNGLIIIPDNWNVNAYTLNDINVSNAQFTSNTITSTQWNVLETSGCVFLPASGGRNGTSIFNVGSYGGYWSATSSNSTNAISMFFNISGVASNYNYYRYDGRSVRLVKEVY